MKKLINIIMGVLMCLLLGAASTPVNAQTVIQGTWATQANDYKGNIGQQYTFYFPPGGTISSRLWGTDLYTFDCSIASAAVHAGLITTQKGGTVTIEIRAGQSSYKGSTRYGVTSNDWGSFDGSFVFVSGNTGPITPTSTIINGTWGTQADDYNGQSGQRFTFYFPPGGTISNRVWGTDLYTTDCSIASAAVHAGLITPQRGGTVTIEIRVGQSSYKGSTRNGVTSKDWGAFASSFVFVAGEPVTTNPNSTVINGTWATQANDYKGNIGQRYTFYFPAGGTISERVWGTDMYTYDCSIASAAVHAGLISARNGGTVTIEIKPGQSSYTGSTRNGVTSKDWGPFEASFIFIRQ